MITTASRRRSGRRIRRSAAGIEMPRNLDGRTIFGRRLKDILARMTTTCS
jgi:hypothetical protein